MERGNVKNTIKTFCAGIALSILAVNTAFGATWTNEGGKWRYYEGQNAAVSKWVLDGNSYYYLDANGNMKTGWVSYNGRWYFLDTRDGGPLGHMLTGWQWIDHKCYYLDPAQGGALIVSGTTPDGYPVNANGEWCSDIGNPYLKASEQMVSVRAEDQVNKDNAAQNNNSSNNNSNNNESQKTSETTDDSVSYSANDFKNGNFSKMSKDEWAETKEAIDNFKETYLTSGMSDFEKEIKIIEWLVENCEYESGSNWSRSTAYSCIINGVAQCSGYADAFLQTAKQCGLDVRYVYNKSHAWNLVKLDGDWYHVDVTWEDPTGSNNYGFGNLRNKYINLEDSQIKNVNFHHTWSPDSIKAKGIKYGPNVVAEYMKSGNVDTSKASSFAERGDKIFAQIEKQENHKIAVFSDVEKTAKEISDYLDTIIDAREEKATIALRFLNVYPASKTGSYSKASDATKEIVNLVNEHLQEKCEGILERDTKLSLYMVGNYDGNGYYYTYHDISFKYSEGNAKQIGYEIHFVDTDGELVGTQEGTADKNRFVELEYPDGYGYITSDKKYYRVKKGKATCNSASFKITGNADVVIEVVVRER